MSGDSRRPKHLMYLVAANNVTGILDRRHVAERFVVGGFECGGLWKRLLR